MSNADDGVEGFLANVGRSGADVGNSGLDHALDTFQLTALSNLNTLFDQIDRAALERAVHALADAGKVLVVGMHSAHSFATYLHHVAAMRFRNWHVVDRHERGLDGILGTLTPADVVVVIAAAPCATGPVEVARHARAAGARVVGITDRRASPLADCANDVLLFPCRSPSVFTSYVGATALVEMLVSMVAARSGGAAGAAIDGPERDRRGMDAER